MVENKLLVTREQKLDFLGCLPHKESNRTQRISKENWNNDDRADLEMNWENLYNLQTALKIDYQVEDQYNVISTKESKQKYCTFC